MAQQVTRKPLYTPTLPSGGHRLGSVSGLTDLAPVGDARIYSPADQFAATTRSPTGRPITVGEYYKMRASKGAGDAGRIVHGLIELALPPVLLGEMAYIKASHSVKAHERIFNLPWDPEGRWRQSASKIMAEENVAGNSRISNLPLPTAARATGRAIVDGTTRAAHAVGTAADAVGDYASDATTTVIRSGRETGRGIMRGLLTSVAMTGQSLFDWANRNKSAFQ